MVDEIITRQELIDAKRDARDLGKAVNEKVIVSPRYGEDFRSLPMIAAEFQISSDAAEAAAVSAAESAGIAQSSANIAEAAATAATISAGVFETPEAGVDPVTGVADGAYFNVRSSSDESYIDEYQNVGGVPTPSGKSYPSASYVQTVAKFTAQPFNPGKTYELHERVQLSDGDIVRSTSPTNTTNPNVNMTGWIREDYGLVKSFISLEEIEQDPYDGQIIFIKTRDNESNGFFSGHFQFVADSTEDVDNGIVLNAEGGRWIRKIENNVIKAQWFGTPNLIDDQKILNPAFNASRKYKLFVDITGNEWGINGVVSALDRVSLISNLDSVIHVDPSGDYPRKFAIEFGLPGSVWYQNGCVLTNTGFLRVDCKNRDTRLHGVFLKGPLSNVDIIRTSNFNGTGIKLESVHDTPLNRLSIEFCGNEEDYAFVCSSADDTTNCININALQVEQSYQRGIYITNTIRSVINNIHSERLFRTNQAPVDNLIGYDLNHVIQMNNSVINQALIHSNDGDIYVRLDGAVNNYNNFLVPDGYVYGEYGDQVIYSCLNTKVFKQLSILKDITLDQPSIPVVHVTIGTKINNPKIDELVFEYAAKSITATGGSIGKVGVRSSEAINGDIVFNNVAIKEVRETGSNSILAMAFNNCNIDLLEGVQGRTCKFRDSYIYRASLASGLQAYFDNVKFDSFTATGDIKYLTRNCQSINNPTWSLPTVPMNKGLITERIGYDATGKIYQNTIDGVNWVKIA